MIAAMKAGLRDRLRGEGGAISAGALIAIALALLVGYLLLAAFEGDTAQFGKVSVPGKGQVELPEGDVDIYYSEGVNPDEGIPLITPDDLRYRVTGPAGQVISTNSRGADAKSTGDGMTRLIGAMKAPVEGFYTVETESTLAGQRITPAVTCGQGPLAAVGQRFDEVVDALRGPLGIVVLVVLVILFLLPRWRLARRRASYQDK